MDEDRWLRLMQRWEFEPSLDTFRRLVEAYSEPERYYHTAEHIDACLRHFDRCSDGLNYPREVETALWFHDAVYQPLADDNEERSALWTREFLRSHGASSEETERVYRLIMATADHHPHTTDASLLIDIDLAILGARTGVYDEFERNVREEYAMVPLPEYREKRAKVLREFLDRDAIYRNEPFASERESQARENLSRAIIDLISDQAGESSG